MAPFQKKDRLLSPRDFKRVYERRCSLSDAWIIVYACPNELGRTRLGLSVSRKIGNAVARNRFKRLAREAFRLSRDAWLVGLDLVVLPRTTQEPALDVLCQSLGKLTAMLVRRLERGPTRGTAGGPTAREKA